MKNMLNEFLEKSEDRKFVLYCNPHQHSEVVTKIRSVLRTMPKQPRTSVVPSKFIPHDRYAVTDLDG